MQALQEAAARGDTATLQAIAQGGRASLGQWSDIAWSGDPKKEDERQEERQLAQALLSGNTEQAQHLVQQANATYKPATGGTISDIAKTAAKVAPIAALAIPGVGPVLGAGIAAGTNALRQATDVQPGFDAGSVARSGAAGAAAGAANQHLLNGQGALAIPAVVGGIAHGAGGVGSALLGAGRQALGAVSGSGSGSGGGFNLGDAAQLGLGIAGTVGAANRQGQSDAYRRQALAGLAERPAPDYSAIFADPNNPYARGRRPLVQAGR